MKTSSLPWIGMAGLGALALVGCGKKETPEAPPESAAASSSLVELADRLGFAGHLAEATPLYLGTAELGGHLENLMKSDYGQRTMAFLEDNVPVEEEETKKEEPLDWEDVDDVFLALGPGGNEAMADWMEVSNLYNQVTYRGLFAGGLATALGGQQKPGDFLVSALADESLVGDAMALLERIESPPLIVGVKSPQAEKWMQSLIEEVSSSDAEVSTLKVAGESEFQVFELKAKAFMTPKWRKQTLRRVKDPEQKKLMEDAIAVLENKTAKLGMGLINGYLVVALGKDDSVFQGVVATPEESLLASSAWNVALPHADRAALGLGFMSTEIQRLSADSGALAPLLDGLLAGVRQSPMFAPIADKLEPMVEDLTATEKVFLKREWQDLAFYAWWEDGIRAIASGGGIGAGTDLRKELTLDAVLEDPELIFGAVGHGTSAGVGRRYFESWMGLLFGLTKEVVGMGLGGETGPEMLKLVEDSVLPPLLAAYDDSKVLYADGLGSESAFLMNLGGKMPALPGVPAGEDKGMLRLSMVHTVKDRSVVAQRWASIEKNLNEMLKAYPAPVPMTLPDVLTSEKNGVSTYFYPLPFMSDDLLLCASINDELLMLGTSKAYNETLAAKVVGGGSEDGDARVGAYGVLNVPILRRVLKQWTGDLPEGQIEGGNAALQLLEPFDAMSYEVRMEEGEILTRMDWPMQDVRQVD